MSATEHTDILIVGAGAYGLATAWWLTERDSGAHVTVVDGRDFAGNGTGRCGAGVRMQWGLECNLRLTIESIRFFEDAGRRLDYPDGIDFAQKGYLLLAPDTDMLEKMRAIQGLQHQFGVPSRIVDQAEARALVPLLNPDHFVGGAHCPKDGTVNPFRYLDALYRAARRGGATVRWGTRVEAIEPRGGAFRVRALRGGERVTIEADRILICTDWWAPQLLRPLGVDYPIEAMPNEAMVLEPWPATLGVCVMRPEHGMFINQVPRGSTVVVVTRERPHGETERSSPDWLGLSARLFAEILPALTHLRVLRQWCSPVSLTPDMQAILGETEIENLFIAVSAYKGFMTSPAVGRIMAELVATGRSNDPVLGALHPRRFKEGNLMLEPLTV